MAFAACGSRQPAAGLHVLRDAHGGFERLCRVADLFQLINPMAVVNRAHHGFVADKFITHQCADGVCRGEEPGRVSFI